MAPLGLTLAQYAVLASLYGLARAGRRPSQRQLADHTGLEALYVSKLARALAGAGLIERTEDPSDSRAVQLTLTPRGRDATEAAIAVVHDLQNHLLAPLGGPGSVRRGIQQASQRLYGSLPADDLATAHRVLAAVTARANADAGL